jgi:hypothetical protein
VASLILVLLWVVAGKGVPFVMFHYLLCFSFEILVGLCILEPVGTPDLQFPSVSFGANAAET